MLFSRQVSSLRRQYVSSSMSKDSQRRERRLLRYEGSHPTLFSEVRLFGGALLIR